MNGGGSQAFSALHGVTVPTPLGFQGFIVLNPKMDVKAVSLLLRAKGDSSRELGICMGLVQMATCAQELACDTFCLLSVFLTSRAVEETAADKMWSPQVWS